MLNVLAKLSHEAEQQGTDSIDAGTQWGSFELRRPTSCVAAYRLRIQRFRFSIRSRASVCHEIT